MKHLLLSFLIFGFGISGSLGQTIKSLGYNTNGQIVAATNVVWTNSFSFSTNTVAAQVRTNLGLGATWLTNSNAPVTTNANDLTTGTLAAARLATNFQAVVWPQATPDYFDDFATYTNGTRVTNGFQPVLGPTYLLNAYYTPTNSTNTAPIVSNGIVRPVGTNETFYLTSVLSNNVRSWGADVKWATDTNTPYSTAVFIIRTNNDFLDDFLHILIGETNGTIQWSTNGAGGLVTIATTNWSQIPQNETIRVLGSISSNVMTLNVGGRTLSATNSIISALAGRYFTFEQFGYGASPSFTGMAQFQRVWANASWQDAAMMSNLPTKESLGLGTTNTPEFAGVTMGISKFRSAYSGIFAGPSGGGDWWGVDASGVRFYVAPYFYTATTNAPFLMVDSNQMVYGVTAGSARTNLGLGSGITTNRTFVSYNGTNYTTNTVTISNGIITGWTQ